MKTISIISLLVLVAILGCKKYPEDSKRYLFKSPKKRLVKTWTVEKLTIDDIDSTERVYKGYYQNPAYEYQFKDMLITFKETANPTSSLSDYNAVAFNPNYVAGTGTGGWVFTSGKSGLIFFFDSSENYTNSFQLNKKKQEWSILTLMENKLVIVTTEGKRKIKLTMR